jgi:hypothetical protein
MPDIQPSYQPLGGSQDNARIPSAGEAQLKRSIDQFMWGYQPHFRHSADLSLRQALAAVAVNVESEYFLVGFRASGTSGKWDICVEPEDGPYQPGDLTDVRERATEFYDADPEREIWNSDPQLHEQRQRWLRDKARAVALERRLASLDHRFSFVVGYSSRVGDFEVHPVAKLRDWEAIPRLVTETRDRIRITRSLPDGVVDEVFRLSHQALLRPDPGAGLMALGSETLDIQRSAAKRLCESAGYLAGHLNGVGIVDAITQISTLPYEGRPPVGELVLAQRNHPALDVAIELSRPVRLRHHRAVRKLFELAAVGVCLMSDGDDVFALGDYDRDRAFVDEDLFVVRVTGTGSWEMHHKFPLLRMEHGIATCPRARLQQAALTELARRRLAPHVERVDIEALWTLLNHATQQIKGAMIIVSVEAAREAERLEPQSTRIAPVHLTRTLLAAATSIDGGVLLDPDGRCHAIGVIVDGTARGQGDPSRGSRFNSALRYLDSDPPPCLILIVSEDGLVDILPTLKPQVPRDLTRTRVNAVVEAAEVEEPNLERFSKAWDRLKEIAFYLSQEQVDAANKAWARVDEYRADTSTIRIIEPPLSVAMEMDDTYLVD